MRWCCSFFFAFFFCSCAAPSDGGPGDCGPPPLFFEERGTVQGDDGDGTCARIERSPQELDDDELCKACPFDLHRLVVVHGEERFDETSGITYTPSHHNWADVASGEGVAVTILYGVDGATSDPAAWSLEVEVEGADVISLPVITAAQ